MEGNDLSLGVFIFPCKDPDLEMRISMQVGNELFYSRASVECEMKGSSQLATMRAPQGRRQPLYSSSLSYVSPLNKDDNGHMDQGELVRVAAPLVSALVGKGAQSAYLWRGFIPEFRWRFPWYSSGGQCYMDVELSS
eukprot:Protomagalhaensia_sp_Gyna_25__2360@NODE_22_length_7715_cov_56_973033_g15_i0_p7_GENE_NODE_22_length_7715_cov_56_973033_g15_i0NODE_22_length_7715_cov_56_973033_g15_i0_p7_ORF_typecomplete_len137_score5_11_NODE_22_length_7715_cov_56_973033_g15_i051065516